MKTIILAGGLGTRLAEETGIRPKPLVEIGGRPILWHIMNLYSAQGYNEFLVAAGYKGEAIKEFFLNFHALNSDVSVNLRTGETRFASRQETDWLVHIVDTGAQTQTGGRVLRLRDWVGNERFMLTYGDGVGDVDIAKLVAFHKAHGKLATVTAVRPPARFGGIEIEDGHVREFMEKPQSGEGWINGGFFVLEPGVFDYLRDDTTVWERDPLERLCADGQLMAYCHEGFWQPMDTLREKRLLEALWESGKAPWKVW